VFSGGNPCLEEIYETLCEKIANNGAVASKNVIFRESLVGIDGNSFEISLCGGHWIKFSTSLGGTFQLDNARTAILAASRLSRTYPLITLEAMKRGMAMARWPGRLERTRFGQVSLILDGAHNLGGITALAETLSRCGLSKNSCVVFAAMKDKDLQGMIRKICESFPMVVFTSVPGSNRSADPGDCLRIAKDLSLPVDLYIEKEPFLAIGKASKKYDSIVCCGSLFLVGAVKVDLERYSSHGVTDGNS
ncbi:MAG: cyanophycin synthetase, partial [Thermovirgaceae bacterium]|nr:cyanophycin synthetase [Thermovirgaceae bacterium]